eukprot:COSAG05_NODE_4743_length_1388_cov_1076.381691_1_plen_26_part_01
MPSVAALLVRAARVWVEQVEQQQQQQ